MPKRPSIACARRAVVQRSLSKPKALGPAANISRTSASWLNDSRLGRPGALRLRKRSIPCPSRVRYQREAVVRLTPNLRATRAWVIPFSRASAASRRLRSISSRFNVTVTAAYIPRADYWPEQYQYTPKYFRCKLFFHVAGEVFRLGRGVRLCCKGVQPSGAREELLYERYPQEANDRGLQIHSGGEELRTTSIERPHRRKRSG